MRTRRTTRSSEVPTKLQGVLENLHATEESKCQTSSGVEHSTLAEASKQDVDKLLDRASVRGATAKERSKRVRDELNFDSRKRGRQKVLGEGESSLFYQRQVSSKNHGERQFDQPENSLVCGAMASTLADVRYGSSSGQENLLPITKESSPSEKNDNMAKTVSNSAESLDKFMGSEQQHSTDLEIKGKGMLEEVLNMDDGLDWEFGCGIPGGGVEEEGGEEKAGTAEISIEVDTGTPTISEKQGGKRVARRATAKDKDFAELVHKAHLLCLIARGRIVDSACNDPLLQASLLSMVPPQINFCDTENTSAVELEPLVKWFLTTFQIRLERDFLPSSAHIDAQEDFTACLFGALEKKAGSSEEVAALSVALLRGVGFTTRYVAALDVSSIKPDATSLEASVNWDPEGNVMAAGLADDFSHQYLNRKSVATLGQCLAQCAPQSLALDTTIKSPRGDMALNISGSPSFSREKGRFRTTRGPARNKGNELLKDSSSPSCTQSVQRKTTKVETRHARKVSKSCNNESSINCPDTTSDASVLRKRAEMSKRKGDLEFEMHLAMAIAATATEVRPNIPEIDTLHTDLEYEDDISPHQSIHSSHISFSLSEQGPKQHNRDITNSSITRGAVWSRKLGPLLHWAEVYSGGGDTGRWVHIDAGRGILDNAGMVEGAAASCKFPIRYVLAFAGNGVKDVTRRYVTSWSAVVPLRVDSGWWSATLAPLMELEVVATSGSPLSVNLQNLAQFVPINTSDPVQKYPTYLKNDVMGTKEAETIGNKFTAGSSSQCLQQACDRSSLEDMELEVRAYTEPIPTNQQAYRNHPLYVLDRWLTKYQTLYPRGPVLGYCAGQPVFPRTCVQNLHTAERWLREGLKVRADETPAKTVSNSRLLSKQGLDDSTASVHEFSGEPPVTALFGKWQTEPWQPPRAIGGVVPKNDRGNVEVWSEKCLPPGTVHMRLPRILPIARSLEIDFAPAMVGYEIRNRRSVPVFEGIVVCQEYETVLLEGYAEEEQRRRAETEKKRERQAIARWSQLLRSIATRQRLQATYKGSQEVCEVLQSSADEEFRTSSTNTLVSLNNRHTNYQEASYGGQIQASNAEKIKHEHTFPEENQSFDDESGTWTKACPCGFTLTVEEM